MFDFLYVYFEQNWKLVTVVNPVAEGNAELDKCIKNRCDKNKSDWKYDFGRSNKEIVKYWFEKHDNTTEDGIQLNFHFKNDFTQFDTGEDAAVWLIDKLLNNGDAKVWTNKQNVKFRIRKLRIRTCGKNNRIIFSGRFWRKPPGNTSTWLPM